MVAMTDAQAVPAPRGLVPLLLTIVPFSQIPLDAYTPALPEMVRSLQADPAAVQNTVTAYMLGMSLALVPVGLITDAVGRRLTLFSGMALLVAMSVACALVSDVNLLLALRFLQGMGGCTCLVVSYVIAADCFRGAKLTSVSGLLGAAWGLAPVLAPAVGGLLADLVSWRVIFLLIGALAAVVAIVAFLLLPETLPPERRAPIDLRAAGGVIAMALRNRLFLCFTLIFGAMASAQLVFGVVAPFLYQEGLGFSPSGYGLMALALGGVNLAGELGCSHFAGKTSPQRLGWTSYVLFALGAVVLAVSGAVSGVGFLSITVGSALVLLGCGVLCPMMYGMALGLFERNLGLLGGLISAICYLCVSGAMVVAAVLPENSQAPMGALYVVLGIIAGLLLAIALPKATALAHS
ncbi:multidrug effflux MFS transporter [Aquabacter cavernae]|uniref:multidrug effflux MFS transporter n=1 Tax=Aquabacter cavernae TaxID=2496029 RepID=UPI000F8ED7FE|nr:multidrug effflux MFS transporter [Aquabacter cavernae]